jgi:hypothetical protein
VRSQGREITGSLVHPGPGQLSTGTPTGFAVEEKKISTREQTRTRSTLGEQVACLPSLSAESWREQHQESWRECPRGHTGSLAGHLLKVFQEVPTDFAKDW